ncbi:MAG: hypothetical protein GF421_00105 [Candidatus Aminicenantes bacterium]|nr:hypothetical protein [Candidatus Aminicenantes bacterium]
MKRVFKLVGIVTLILCFSGLLSAQIQRPTKPFKIELGINFGSTLGYNITDSTYVDSWGTSWYDVDESGTISPELSNPLSLGGNISLITNMGIGVQFALDYNFNSDVTGTSSYSGAGYDWWIGSFDYNSEWDITGTVKMMVLSLDFIYKYYSDMFCPWFAAGGSYFSGNLEASTNVGFGFDYWSYFNYAKIAADINEDMSGIGFNVGAGFDIHFSPNIAFTLEGRYFILKKYEFNWMTDFSGQHEMLGYFSGTVSFSSPSAYEDYLDELIESFEFNPSFPKIAAGFKFSF